MLALLKKKSFRDSAAQMLFVGSLVALAAVFAITAKVNLDAQGLTSGF